MSANGSGANEFENAAGNTAVQGENELAQQMNQSVPQMNANVATENSPSLTAQLGTSGGQEENSAESANSAESVAPENTAAPANTAAPENTAAAALPTSTYQMSQKAKDLQARRKVIYEDMKREYSNVFGDDKRAPKAKMYHAAGLLTIKERDGEQAYRAKLQEYIDANRGKYSNKTQKASTATVTTTKKAKKASHSPQPASVVHKSASPQPVTAANSASKIITSIQGMAETMKGMLDTMVSTTKTLVKSNTGNLEAVAAKVVRFASETPGPVTAKKPRKPRSNKGSTHKKHAKQGNIAEL